MMSSQKCHQYYHNDVISKVHQYYHNDVISKVSSSYHNDVISRVSSKCQYDVVWYHYSVPPLLSLLARLHPPSKTQSTSCCVEELILIYLPLPSSPYFTPSRPGTLQPYRDWWRRELTLNSACLKKSVHCTMECVFKYKQAVKHIPL